MLRTGLSLCVLGWQLAVPAIVSVADELPAGAQLQTFPEQIRLTTARDRQGLVVVTKFDDGSTRDVTLECTMRVAAPALVRLEGARLLPIADGKTELIVESGGNKSVVPVEVTRAAEAPVLRFRNDVLPVLTRAGCNTGKCHGAASGKDGFRLSLFGYDPA